MLSQRDLVWRRAALHGPRVGAHGQHLGEHMGALPCGDVSISGVWMRGDDAGRARILPGLCSLPEKLPKAACLSATNSHKQGVVAVVAIGLYALTGRRNRRSMYRARLTCLRRR